MVADHVTCVTEAACPPLPPLQRPHDGCVPLPRLILVRKRGGNGIGWSAGEKGQAGEKETATGLNGMINRGCGDDVGWRTGKQERVASALDDVRGRRMKLKQEAAAELDDPPQRRKWQRAALDGQQKRSLPRQGALSGQRHDCHMLRKLKKKSRVMLSLKKCPIEILFT